MDYYDDKVSPYLFTCLSMCMYLYGCIGAVQYYCGIKNCTKNVSIFIGYSIFFAAIGIRLILQKNNILIIGESRNH